MLLTLRGTPFLYYGEEIGMRDGEIPPERICDPVGKRFPSLGRDPERTPMQWDASPSARIQPTPRTPWLPLAADVRSRQRRRAKRADPRLAAVVLPARDLVSEVGAGAARGHVPRASTRRPTRSSICASTPQQRLLVALNFGDEPRAIELPRREARRRRRVDSTTLRASPAARSLLRPRQPARSIDVACVTGSHALLEAAMDWKLIASTFGVIFLAELGDKTQLAAMTMSASSQQAARASSSAPVWR